MNATPLTTHDMLLRLETRFCLPAWVTIRECSDRTGWRNRAADLIALGVWPSRGLEIIGVEIKASRGDWMKELKEPAKADAIAPHCDRWYVAVTDPAIIQPGELPANWGLIVPRGEALKIVTEAPFEDKGAVKRTFFMAMIRRVTEGTVSKELFEKKLDEAFKQREQDLKSNWDWQHKHNDEQLKKLSEKVAEFEKASGVRIGAWWENGKEIGEAVRFVMNHKPDEHIEQLKWLSDRLKSVAETVDRDIENLHAVAMAGAKKEGL